MSWQTAVTIGVRLFRFSFWLAKMANKPGNACTTGQVEASHVLRAIGLSEPLAQESIRFSLGEDNTEEEVDTIVRVLTEQVQKLRAMRGYV